MEPADSVDPLVLIEDEPVGAVELDRLELLPFAQVIAGTAIGTTGPFTIGVYGDWGQGKTSVLRLAHRLLEAEFERGTLAHVVPVWFNAWQYEREEHPIVPLLATIVRSLDERNAQIKSATPSSQLRPALSTVARALRAIAYGFSAKAKIKVPGFAELESGFVAREMVQRYEQLSPSPDPLLERSLYYRAFDLLQTVTRDAADPSQSSELAPKIIVFIDDLDRCLPPQSLQLLESLKLVLSQPGFIFALAVDRRILVEYLRHRFRADLGAESFDGLGLYYLDKLVQLPLPLPPHERRFLHYIQRLLEEAPALRAEPNQPVKEALQDLVPVLAVGSNYNPRNLVRFVNNLIVDRRLWSSVDKEREIDANLLGLCAVSRILQQHLEDYHLYRFLVRNQNLCSALAAGELEAREDVPSQKGPSDWESNPLVVKVLDRFRTSDFLRQLLEHDVARRWLTSKDARLEVDDFLSRSREGGVAELSGQEIFEEALRSSLGATTISPEALLDVERLDLSNSTATDGTLTGLARTPNLRYLNLSDSTVSNEGLENLKFVPNLEALNISYCKYLEGGVPALKWLRNLRDLNLFKTKIDDRAILQIKELNLLHELDLWATAITDQGLGGLTSLVHLKDLDIGATAVTDSGLVHLLQLSKLEWLTMDRTSISDVGLETIKELVWIENLDLRSTKITDVGLSLLSTLVKLRGLMLSETAIEGSGFESLQTLGLLTRLNLAGSGIKDEAVPFLAQFPALSSLDLTSTRIGDSGFEGLSEVSSLEELVLRSTNLRDENVDAVASLKFLGRLDISKTKVGAEGLRRLAVLPRLRSIKVSAALENEEGTEAFRSRCPNCKIEFVA